MCLINREQRSAQIQLHQRYVNDFIDCKNATMDLVFVVDGSGSICDNDPEFRKGIDTTCDNWKFILKFMRDMTNSLTIGMTATRVGLVTFATKAQVAWNLTR